MSKKDSKIGADGTDPDTLSLLEQLPTDLLQGPIAQYLSDKDLGNFCQTSKTMFFTYREPLEKKAASTLLAYVLNGQEKKALKMIDAYPHLLLIASEAIDYSGRSYRGFTPFQGALLCHDVVLWEKIIPYFDKLPHGRKEKVKQFKVIFPQGLPQQVPYDFSSLVQVISNSSEIDIEVALQKVNNNTPICHALKSFRTTFTELAIKENFFNPCHLIQSREIFNKQFNTWSTNHRNLFLCQVIGYVQRFVPACYAQATCRDFSIVEDERPWVRALCLMNGGSYYPLTESSGLVLGFDFAIYGHGYKVIELGCMDESVENLRNHVALIISKYLNFNKSDHLLFKACCAIS